MLRSSIWFVAAVSLARVALGESAPGGPPRKRSEKVVVRDTVRVPYLAGKVYQIKLMPGAPFALELPAGESARNIWVDNRWWKAESTPGSSRVFLRALGSDDVVGRLGFIHVETDPSDYRISLRVEGVPETAEVSAGLEILRRGQSAQRSGPAGSAKNRRQGAALHAAARAGEGAGGGGSLAQESPTNVRADYEWGGDFRIGRVVDDRVQTFVTVPDASDRAVIQFVDKAGRVEVVTRR